MTAFQVQHTNESVQVTFDKKSFSDEQLLKLLNFLGVGVKEKKDNESIDLKQDTYPFKPNVIRYGNSVFVLNDKLDCIVDYEDDSFSIKNELLDINVWGDTREEAETAFSFSFYALYENFALEIDAKLSLESRELKKKLLKIVKTVVHEA